MRRITSNVWSHHSTTKQKTYPVVDVRCSRPAIVRSFRELVIAVAQIGYHNPDQVLFYRGQERAYRKRMADGRNGDSVYPTIYRKEGGSISEMELERRFAHLQENAAILCKEFKNAGILGH